MVVILCLSTSLVSILQMIVKFWEFFKNTYLKIPVRKATESIYSEVHSREIFGGKHICKFWID